MVTRSSIPYHHPADAGWAGPALDGGGVRRLQMRKNNDSSSIRCSSPGRASTRNSSPTTRRCLNCGRPIQPLARHAELVANDNPRVISYLRVLGKERFLVVVSLLPKETEVVFSPRDLARLGIACKVKLTELFPRGRARSARPERKDRQPRAYAGRCGGEPVASDVNMGCFLERKGSPG
jgi:hypothetical protein